MCKPPMPEKDATGVEGLVNMKSLSRKMCERKPMIYRSKILVVSCAGRWMIIGTVFGMKYVGR